MELPVPIPTLLEEPPGWLTPVRSCSRNPHDESPNLTLIADYAELAFAHPNAPWLLCGAFSSLTHLRAALLGGRQTGRPLAALVVIEESGLLPSGGNPLSALLMAKSLGCRAFGLHFPAGELDLAAALFAQMATLTDLPLFAQPDQSLPLESIRFLLDHSVRGFCPNAVVKADETAAAGLLRTYNASSRPAELTDASLLVCNETAIFYLDEYFELSEPVQCSLDMFDALLAAEEERCDVVSVALSCGEDALAFSENQHLLRLPVAFLAAEEESLELALIHYNGRAIVDSRSDVPDERLAELAAGYGALLR